MQIMIDYQLNSDLVYTLHGGLFECIISWISTIPNVKEDIPLLCFSAFWLSKIMELLRRYIHQQFCLLYHCSHTLENLSLG